MATNVYNYPSHSSGTQTNGDTYLPSGGAFVNTKGASSVTLITRRTAETGTSTLLAFGEFLYEPTNTWYTWLDHNNATQIQGVVYADGALDDSAPFYRFLTIQQAPVEVDADTVKIVNTVHKLYQGWIPERIRFRFRHGGTTVTNTFSAMINVHTAR